MEIIARARFACVRIFYIFVKIFTAMKEYTFKKTDLSDLLFYCRMGVIQHAPSDKVYDWSEKLLSFALESTKNFGDNVTIQVIS